MNILEQSEALKSIPEDALMREMQQPTSSMPQFLVLTELKRRKRMRDEYNRRKAQDIPTVAEEVVMGAGMPQEGIMQMSKSMAPKSSIAQNTGQQEAAPREPTMGMASGGLLSLAKGDKLGKPVVYNGDTYMVDDKGQVYFNRRRVADRKLRDAVLQKAASDAAGDVDDSPTPQPKTGSQLLDEAQASMTGSQMFSPSNIPSVDDDLIRPPISGFPPPEGSVDLPVFDATAPDSLTKRGMPEGFSGDPRLQGGILDYMRGTGMPAAAEPPEPRFQGGAVPEYIPSSSSPTGFIDAKTGRPVSGSVAEGLQPQQDQQDLPNPIDFSNITAYPPTLNPMEIAVRKNIAEQEATLPETPQSISATPPGYKSPQERSREAALTRTMNMLNAQAEAERDKERELLGEGIMQGRAGPLTGVPLTGPQKITQTLMETASTVGEGISDFVTPDKSRKERALENERRKLGESILAGRAGTQTGFVEDIVSPDGTADAETIETETVTQDLPDELLTESFSSIIKKGNDVKPSKDDDIGGGGGASRTTGGTGGAGGSPLRSRIEQLIADREKDREADKWMALAETGLALMASTNPTLGGAIGEAGLVGVGAMKEAKSQYDKDMLELLGLQEEMRQSDLSYSYALAEANQKALPKPRTPAEINSYLDYYRDIEKKLGTVVEVDDLTGKETRTFDPAKVPQDIKDEIFRLEEQYRSLFPSATVNLADV